jgi:hypothetical protein
MKLIYESETQGYEPNYRKLKLQDVKLNNCCYTCDNCRYAVRGFARNGFYYCTQHKSSLGDVDTDIYSKKCEYYKMEEQQNG